MRKIFPSTISGAIKIIPSKSMSHRVLICAALAKGVSKISNIAFSDDVCATVNALRDMGLCEYKLIGGDCVISGGLNKPEKELIDCAESGSTLRFLLPLALDKIKRTFFGHGRLMQRPLHAYEQIFEHADIIRTEEALTICGELIAGNYELRGDLSSQFISGLLFALPLLKNESTITVTTELESKAYVEMTRDAQKLFGVHSEWRKNCIHIDKNQRYIPCNTTIEADYSHAAFFAAGAAISGEVVLKGLNINSLQGDKEILGILKCMGADVQWNNGEVHIKKNTLKAVDIDVSQIPDLVPILAVLACATDGKMRIYHAKRLRYKESDRLYAITCELEKLGADITEYEDSLVINGTGKLNGGVVDSHDDHRIAMALSIAACLADGEITIQHSSAVSKSAPEFFNEFLSIGGKIQ